MKTAGIVLAGGLSRRMGVDKAFLELGGETAIHRAVERLGAQISPLAINANDAPERFAPFGLPVIADGVPDHAGPLAGVLAGMDWAAGLEAGATHIVTAAVDTPFFPENIVVLLEAAVAESGQPTAIAMAASGGRTHPVFGLWPLVLRDDLHRFLVEEEGRKILAFAERYDLRIVEFESGEDDPFFNINRPEDLATGERRLAHG